ncbi:hypothetical protein HMPREF9996_02271 [Aggregatibacter actinomycetemcomitans Y4]|nr:hypothetical protein HMPREF9996_02271 [Aggregatibacter actinomycetemcomitans Y4]
MELLKYHLHCRIGSLEMRFRQILDLNLLHCRIGSLEKENKQV